MKIKYEMKSTTDIRQAFLDYFASKQHTVVPSSPLVPGNDPTLLFTNAGMVQFKEVFTGEDKRPYSRAATSQRCVRAGGKHNDLDNVGYTARHHTFFEMLGNFSFGDYFKQEAIEYAWEFLTVVLGLPEEKLWITVYQDDDEAADIWLNKMGVSDQRFSRCGEEDNFWTMGPTGPCGPCTEIFYDHGEDVPGGPPGSPDQDGDRYIEIWNLVFTQFDRDEEGNLNPLPRPSVDTGMGLERIAAVMQGAHNNYDIDLFQGLINAIKQLIGRPDEDSKSLQVVADHLRSCSFIIMDGVVPSNEGRGYVLRRIIRRAIRHGHKLGLMDAFFYRLVEALEKQMGEAYPELSSSREMIEGVLKKEEERFNETLEQGLRLLDQVVANIKDQVIPGAEVFKLYDTYGFPVDLTADIARERGLSLDMAGFEAEMNQQRERARAASNFSSAGTGTDLPELDTPLHCSFSGYESVADEATITGLFVDGESVETLKAGETGVVVMEHTPFYAESGGQVGDAGQLLSPTGQFEVADTRKKAGVHFHLGTISQGQLNRGDRIKAHVDAERRQAIVLNHSATHLMHAALRKVLGEHVLQKGSLVAPDRLRFDFSHTDPVTDEELATIESMVNAEIRANLEVQVKVMPMQAAIDSGAMALFGEKYEDEVRVLSIGDFSTELCGGTHAQRSGDIGLFKIVSESGVAAGVRRIEALTGEQAHAWMAESETLLKGLAGQLKGTRETLGEKIEQLLSRSRQQEKDIQALKSKLSSSSGSDLGAQAKEIDGIKVLAAEIEGADTRSLRELVDQLKNKLGTAALVLAAVEDGKVTLIAGVTTDAIDRIKAGELVNHVASQIGGKGGGRPDMAQAGGSQPENLAEALESVEAWVSEKLT